MAGSLLSSFLGALQASLSVLLTILYGVIGAQFKLLDGSSAKSISSICVRMFLPALLITNVGSELHIETGMRYIPILLWGLLYTLSSMGFGIAMTKLFKLPQWVTPAMCFNNTTSLPLLLIQSLDATGILDRLIITDESGSQAIKRAKSYVLVNAIVGNCLTFAIGPRLIDSEHARDESKDGKKDDEQEHQDDDGNGDEEQANGQVDEQTSLLPNSIQQAENAAESMGQKHVKTHWQHLQPRTQGFLAFCYDFFNAPLIGAVIGATIGLAPPLHRIFFNDPQSGGIFSAWLTTSLSNIGDLFASLQTVVVGVSLSSSLRKLKRGEDSGKLPWNSSLLVLFVRFLLWPVLSIAVVWAFATRTKLLGDDPILWFAMMLMPCGPPAMKLVAMADVNGADEKEKMKIAKFLTISYALSPALAFAVVGALKASEVAINS